jgi:outer membrane protein assembly factor BamB
MTMRLAAAVLIILALSPAAARAVDWPNYHGPNYNLTTTETVSLWPPVEAWRKEIGQGYAGVAVVNNLAYTAGWDGANDVVFCLDSNSGKTLWSGSYAMAPRGDMDGIIATPTVSGGKVYTLSKVGDMYCWDAVTGHPDWNINLLEFTGWPAAWGFGGSLLVDGDLIVVNANHGGLGIDKNTHDIRWRSTGTDGGGYSSPWPLDFGSNRIALFSQMNSMVGVDMATGSLVFSYPWAAPGCPTTDPQLWNGKLFLSNYWGPGCALVDISSGAPHTVWSNMNMQNDLTTSVIVGDYVYGSSGGTNGPVDVTVPLTCLDLATGAVKWADKGLNLGVGSPIAIGNKQLLVLGETGTLVVVDADPVACRVAGAGVTYTGTDSEWWTVPVLSHGKIFIRNHGGTLIALNATAPVVYGDANGDGAFTMADLNVLVDMLLSRTAPSAAGSQTFIRCDVNGDGKIDLADLNLDVDRLLGRTTKFPVER